ESAVAAKSNELEQLRVHLNECTTKNALLEKQLNALHEDNTALSIKYSDLQTQLQHSDEVIQSTKRLEDALISTDRDLQQSRRDMELMRCQMASNELIMKHMRESLEKKRELDGEQARLRRLIEEKSSGSLFTKNGGAGGEETVDALRARLRELEKKSELQSLRHEELMLELEASKKKQKYEQLRHLASTADRVSEGGSVSDALLGADLEINDGNSAASGLGVAASASAGGSRASSSRHAVPNSECPSVVAPLRQEETLK
uniref:HOOK domain-containing protein n=1 Tax=Macrostomum lignano TaxID=282301 RepID=A0A1I8IJL5_9PLAT